jgi:2-C-methyl-D-erythritol 4-phosphate cytidylyltransferase
MRIHAVVLAAGSGSRFGGEVPKQLALLAGEPIVRHAARSMLGAGIDSLVVVAHPTWLAQTREAVELFATGLPGGRLTVVEGGETRVGSSRAGLAVLDALDAGANDVVIVHDAARPLVSVDLIRRIVEPIAAGLADGAVPVLASPDTVVVVDREAVVEVPDRSRYRLVQTPQAFARRVLLAAHAAALAAGDGDATDDAGLVLRHAPEARIVAVPGDPASLKVTTVMDLQVVEALLDQARRGTERS